MSHLRLFSNLLLLDHLSLFKIVLFWGAGTDAGVVGCRQAEGDWELYSSLALCISKVCLTLQKFKANKTRKPKKEQIGKHT